MTPEVHVRSGNRVRRSSIKAVIVRAAMLSIALTATITSAADTPAAVQSTAWETFWLSHGVAPAPPQDFMDVSYTGEVINLTKGQLTDADARRYAIAALRRGRGDTWAYHYLRDDLVGANILGPPGLSSTDKAIAKKRGAGVAYIESLQPTDVVSVAVLAPLRLGIVTRKWPSYSDIAVVLVFRAGVGGSTTHYSDGRVETKRATGDQNTFYWQYDAGELRHYPALGDVWYQKQGWSCVPHDGTNLGEMCALVRPDLKPAVMAGR